MDYRVFQDQECLARFVYPDHAAAFVAVLGHGSTVRVGRRVVWTEGVDGDAGESYDGAAEVMNARADAS